jgi:RNA polymerase sigma-70 factor (ECF subfamily)
VYEQEYSYVYNYIYMQVMHRENTEDLVSDIFMRAMSHYDSFDPSKASVRTWLCTIARNCLIDYFRKNGRRKTENLDDAPEPSAVDEYDILKNPVNQEVYRLLEKLNDEERELLSMIYVQELKNPQIGEILGINAKAVSERHRRLLAKLRAMEKGKNAGDFLDYS